MVNRHTALKIRKIHRYLGLFLGIQFLFWTISGMYFSWTNIDDIHGDQFRNLNYQPKAFTNLISPTQTEANSIQTIELRDINNTPYYWVNNSELYNAVNGTKKQSITEEEALYIAKNHMNSDFKVASIEQINEVDKHHEYREKLLPAYVISYQSVEYIYNTLYTKSNRPVPVSFSKSFIFNSKSRKTGVLYLASHNKDENTIESSNLVRKKIDLKGKTPLTNRELEIIKLIVNDYSSQEIAEKLFISIRTVETHRKHIMEKLHTKSLIALVKYVIQNGLA